MLAIVNSQINDNADGNNFNVVSDLGIGQGVY